MRITSPAAMRRNGIIVGSARSSGPGLSVTEPVLPSPPPNSPGGRVALPSPSSETPPASRNSISRMDPRPPRVRPAPPPPSASS